MQIAAWKDVFMFPIVFLLAAAGEILTKLTTTREKVLVERKIFIKQCDPVLVPDGAGNGDRGQTRVTPVLMWPGVA